MSSRLVSVETLPQVDLSRLPPFLELMYMFRQLDVWDDFARFVVNTFEGSR